MNVHRVSHKAPKVSRNGGKPPLTGIPEARVQRCYKCGLQSSVRFDYQQGRWPAYWACHDCGDLIQATILAEQPSPIPEIEIRRIAHYWAIVIGHVVRSTPFVETADPFRVCKWIQRQTAGPVNVVVNL